jgi:hypothetical protein
MIGRVIIIALLVVGGLLIVVGQLGMPSENIGSTLAVLLLMWQVKVALASVLGLALIILLVRAVKKSAPGTPTPGYKKAAPVKLGFTEFVIDKSISILFIAIAVWVASMVLAEVPKIFGVNHYWVQDQPEMVVVNNGFPRHDAPSSPIITPIPLKKKVRADVIYDAFWIKKGDHFKLTFNRPVQLRIKGPGSTGFATYKTPERYRASNSGMIQVRSETGGNHVRVAPST